DFYGLALGCYVLRLTGVVFSSPRTAPVDRRPISTLISGRFLISSGDSCRPHCPAATRQTIAPRRRQFLSSPFLCSTYKPAACLHRCRIQDVLAQIRRIVELKPAIGES